MCEYVCVCERHCVSLCEWVCMYVDVSQCVYIRHVVVFMEATFYFYLL